jgi:hypothetical protein
MNGYYGQPSAAQLVEAVKEYLSEEVLARAPKADSYHLRVAISALGIVERELLRGQMSDHYFQQLRTLGFESEVDLAKRIRDGEVSELQLNEIKPPVLAHVEEKLTVSNPTFVRTYESQDVFP